MDEFDESVLKEIFEANDTINTPSQPTFLVDICEQAKQAALNNTVAPKKTRKKNVGHVHIKEGTLPQIHKGDTDSSDDEDNRNCHDQKYNEYGRSIKNLIVQEENSKPISLLEPRERKSLKESSTWKTFQSMTGNESFLDVKKGDVYSDPVFGIRIIKPQISSNLIKERMVGRTPVSMTKIKNFIETQDIKNKDWVTGGVIIGTHTKTSQKGNQYCIWTMTDLHNEIKTISVFLFGSACKDLWKTQLGVVAGILNPNVLEKKESTKHEVTFSIDNAQKVMIFGTSKDYGICKSKTKSGDACFNVVNLSKCEFCVYHLKQEYKKVSGRMELQSSCAGRGLNTLRNKVLGKSEVFYAGKSFMANSAKKNHKQVEKDNKLLNKLNLMKGRTLEKDKTLLEKLNSSNQDKAPNKVNSPTSQTNNKEKTLLEKLHGSSQEKTVNKFNSLTSHIESSVTNYTANVQSAVTKNPCPSSTQIKSPTVPKSSSKITANNIFSIMGKSPLEKPLLLKNNHSPSNMIDLNVPISKKRLNYAKMSAIEYVKRNGINQEIASKEKTPVQKEAIKRKIESQNEHANKKQKVSDEQKDGKTLLKEKLNRIGITDEFKALMNSGSVNEDLVKLGEREQQEKYYKKLEIKEQIEEKMAATHKVECKAVRCLKCNYKSFSASDLCKAENHPLKVVNAIKRFWKCGDCNNRTVCLELVPLHPCKVCASSKWVKASMMKDSKDNNLIRPELSIRGHEESYVGANFKGNLNLLVPD